LERFEAEITGLSNEIAAMAEEEKQSAAELRFNRVSVLSINLTDFLF